MVACDVGQGDALVLATGQPGRVVLVDAGPGDGPLDACLDRLGVTALALVVISHLHADHVDGLPGALRGRAVGVVAVGPVREPIWTLERVRRQAESAGARMVQIAAGVRLGWPALTLEVLGPLVLSVIAGRSLVSLLWAALALGGVVTLSQGGFSSLDPVGVAFALGAAVLWATYIVFAGRTGGRFPRLDGLALARYGFGEAGALARLAEVRALGPMAGGPRA